MGFSRKTDYGLILLEALKPTYASGEHVSLKAVAQGEHLPFAFLEKLAGMLRKEGILEATRGASGGYRLIRNPASLTLREVIRIFEEPPMMRCLRSPHPEKYCPLVATCPTRKTWQEVEGQVNRIFENVTMAQI